MSQDSIEIICIHRWLVNQANEGICRNCGAEKKFPKDPTRNYRNNMVKEKAPPDSRIMVERMKRTGYL